LQDLISQFTIPVLNLSNDTAIRRVTSPSSTSALRHIPYTSGLLQLQKPECLSMQQVYSAVTGLDFDNPDRVHDYHPLG